jgi:hypothetical protein
MTDVIGNAANLAQLLYTLPKASKISDGNENLKKVFPLVLLGLLKIYDF